MKFVVKEGLSVDPRASLARAASVDGALFGLLPIDFFRQRSGEDSSRMEIPEAAADARSAATSAFYRVKSPDTPRFGKAIQNDVYPMRRVFARYRVRRPGVQPLGPLSDAAGL